MKHRIAKYIVCMGVATLAVAVYAEDKPEARPQTKPRFTVVQGKGWSVCEHYARFLNARPEQEPLPLCHLKLSPELKEPDWENLDIRAHLQTIYSIEHPPYRNAINPDKPPPPFDQWKTAFEQRQREGQSPRLRRTRLALVEGGPVETILAYEADRNRCDRTVLEKGYSHEGDGVELALLDEREGKISDYQSMLAFTSLPSRLLLFHGRPFMFWTFLGNMSTTPQRRFEMRIGVHYFLFIPSMAEPYGQTERCQISFPLPSNIVERMTK